MKRAVLLLLSAAMLFLFAACSGETKQHSDTEVSPAPKTDEPTNETPESPQATPTAAPSPTISDLQKESFERV